MNRLQLQIPGMLLLLLFSEGCKKSESGSPVPPATPAVTPAAPAAAPIAPGYATTAFFSGPEDRDVRISEK